MRLTLFIILITLHFGFSQKVHISKKGILTIDSTIVMNGYDRERLFNYLKKWAIVNVPDYNSLVRGEVAPDLVKFIYITDYFAVGGRQKYSQDVTFDISDNQFILTIDNLRTYVPDKNANLNDQIRKGWSADKFFISSDGKLKPGFRKFYVDVESRFKEMIDSILENSN